MRRQGATPRKLRLYPGLKEEIYLGDFEPDRDVLAAAGIERGPDDVVVVARTPPVGRALPPVREPAVRRGPAKRSRALPRLAAWSSRAGADQREAIAALSLPNVVAPRACARRALADARQRPDPRRRRDDDARGRPARACRRVSLFAGRTPAVDRWLEERGALRRVSDDRATCQPIRRRASEPRDPAELRARSERLVGEFVTAVLEAAARRAAGRRRGSRAWLAEPLAGSGRRSRPSSSPAAWRGGATTAAGAAPIRTRASAPSRRLGRAAEATPPLGRRLLIQAVKRSPLDLRPRARHRAQARRGVASPGRCPLYARNGFLDPDEAEPMLARALESPRGPALAGGYEEPCWGYHFDFQSRVFFYRPRRAEHDRHRFRRPRPARRARGDRRSSPAGPGARAPGGSSCASCR